MLGLRPSFRSDFVLSKVAYPTPLGVVIPEVGIVWHDDRADPYLAWRAPVEYRKRAPTERQHPLTLAERLAFTATPIVLVTLGEPPHDWSAGLSLGLTVW